jgi:hypothetical protein
MRQRGFFIVVLVVLLVAAAGTVTADVKTRGQIEGTVRSEDGLALPGATVTLTGRG